MLLPLRLGFVPLLIAVYHLPNIEAVNFGGAGFTVVRLLIFAGLLRAVSRGILSWSATVPLDRLLAVWAAIALVSTVGHHPRKGNPLTERLSLIYDLAGVYLYARSYVRSKGDFLRVAKVSAIVVVAAAAPLLAEKVTARNFYAGVGAGSPQAAIRGGKVRASGPFAHPILLGTAGAVAIPLIFALRRASPRRTAIGALGCAVVVYASGSSGPIMTLMTGAAALFLWRWRGYLRRFQIAAILAILGLHFVMKSPVWYLLARIDLTGGSTGWHRAELITQALEHFGEWWLIGTDHTRHWMPTGVWWSDDHTDITNYYLKMGVIGGLALMLSFIAMLVSAFRTLGRTMKTPRVSGGEDHWLLWCLGSALFAHVITFFSVYYYDQSFVLFAFPLGLVPGVCSAVLRSSIIKKGADPAGSCGTSVVSPLVQVGRVAGGL